MTDQLPAVIERTKIIGDGRPLVVPALIAAAGDRARSAFWNSSRRTSATRTRAGPTAAPWRSFWPGARTTGVPSITAVQPLHVAAWIEHADARACGTDRQAAPGRAAPSVRLAGDRPGHAGEPGRLRARPVARA